MAAKNACDATVNGTLPKVVSHPVAGARMVQELSMSGVQLRNGNMSDRSSVLLPILANYSKESKKESWEVAHFIWIENFEAHLNTGKDRIKADMNGHVKICQFVLGLVSSNFS